MGPCYHVIGGSPPGRHDADRTILSGRDVLGKDGDTDVSLYYDQCIAL